MYFFFFPTNLLQLHHRPPGDRNKKKRQCLLHCTMSRCELEYIKYILIMTGSPAKSALC